MKTIPLTQGKVVLVDDGDYSWLSRWKWYAQKVITKNRTLWYAVRSERTPDGIKRVYMHRELGTAAGIPEVDHRDANGLNNQSGNLRPATVSQNNQNRRKSLGHTSRFKGVYWNVQKGKWKAQLGTNGRVLFLGYFVDETKAAEAYSHAAAQHFGQFALASTV